MSGNFPNWKRYLSPRFLASKVQENGVVWCLRMGFLKFLRVILRPIIMGAFFIPSYVLRIASIRFLTIRYLYSIGHLAAEPCCYLKEQFMGAHPKYLVIMLAPSNKVANRCLLEYWRKYFKIITSPTLCLLLYPLSEQKILKCDIEQYVMNDHEEALIYEVNNKWVGRPPLLSLSESDRERGWRCLQDLGIPEGAWYVCIHCREPGNRPQDKSHVHRDVDIYTYFLAMKAIVDRGGWCIRLGDTAMKPLPPMHNVIDYAHLGVKSDWMDVFLCASGRFLLGSNSGLSVLVSVFGIPCALANIIPLSVLPVQDTDIGIPKLLWSNAEQRYLTFREVLDSPMSKANFFGDMYEKADIKIVDNSPEEIRDLALEMLDRVEGRTTYTSDDERLQQKFKLLLKPGHYGYRASSRLCSSFLRKYEILLPEEDKKEYLSPGTSSENARYS